MAFFRNRRFSAAISSLALLGMFFLMIQYLQFSLGFSPLQTGLRVAPIALVLLVAAPASVLLARSRRLGTKPVVGGGMLLIAVGLGLLSRTSTQSTYTDLLPAFLLIGIGVGLALAPSTESVMGSLPAAGVGSATDDTALQIGGALGVGVLGTLLNAHYRSQMSAFLNGFSISEGVRRSILGSVGGAQPVAQRVPGPSATPCPRRPARRSGAAWTTPSSWLPSWWASPPSSYWLPCPSEACRPPWQRRPSPGTDGAKRRQPGGTMKKPERARRQSPNGMGPAQPSPLPALPAALSHRLIRARASR